MSVDYDISKWIALADKDLAVAHHLCELFKPMPCEAVCFHSQQVVGKILKGYLFSNDIKAPKTHDLEVLCDMCVKIESSFNVFGRELLTLTPYGVMPRYPDEIELEEHDAEIAAKYADKIMEFVKGLLET
jgi:HEPN domain-containing protein